MTDPYFNPDLIWDLYTPEEIDEILPGPLQGPHLPLIQGPSLPLTLTDWED